MKRLILVISLASVFAPVIAYADTVIATSAFEVELDVPDPNNPGQCIRVVFGQIVARTGFDALSMTNVSGFKRTYNGATCCERLEFLNVVIKDPIPPKWKDANGGVHVVDVPYIDPLSGGNIPPNGLEPNPVADRKPYYDGVWRNRRASDVGNFSIGDHPEYDLNQDHGGGADWSNDPSLEIVFGDRPTQTAGLEFVTILMCAEGTKMCPIGGYTWGRTAGGSIFQEGEFSGNSFSGGLTKQKIQDALNKSGFGGYTIEDTCCPCAVPEPSSMAALGIGALVVFRRRVRPNLKR